MKDTFIKHKTLIVLIPRNIKLFLQKVINIMTDLI